MKNLQSDSYDKNVNQKKANVLVRLHEAMEEKMKTASYSESPIQILTLAPDKWSRMYCSEYFNIFEYLVWTSHEIKKVGGILAKSAPKKGKAITTGTFNLLTNVYEDDNFSRYAPEKEDYVSVSNGIHKQKLCTLHELYTGFKEKHPNSNIGFWKSCALRPKWCALAGSKVTHSVCICSAHQSVVLLIDVMDWNVTYKDLIKLTLSCLNYFH